MPNVLAKGRGGVLAEGVDKDAAEAGQERAQQI